MSTTLVAYADSDDGKSDAGVEQQPEQQQLTTNKRPKIEVAPEVNTQDLDTFAYIPSQETRVIQHNVPFQEMSKPVSGPTNPFRKTQLVGKNTLTGHVEEHGISDYSFTTMERTFNRFKYTVDPNGNGFVGDINKAIEMNGAMITDNMKKLSSSSKRKAKGDPSDINGYLGPWAGYEGEDLTKDEIQGLSQLDAERLDAQAAADDAEAKRKAAAAEEAMMTGSETSTFHGSSLLDYLGRTYMHVPTDTDSGVNLRGEPGTQECFLPKKHLHTWTGHTKGVNAIRFFPNSAHLLLSASMDNTVKLWDVYNERRCLRTFNGHYKGVKDICFSNDGKTFLTCSYDKMIKLWDTESGKCIRGFTTKRIPNCVKFNPDPEKQNIFLTGCADKKIYQFDIASGEVVQEYDQHLGAVNTITFVDENRRFVSTSDDKTLRAWEFDIPVVIKYIAEPDMHSMPAVTLAPNKKWIACTSLDNQILIYNTKDKFRLNHSKIFKGHLVAGYACQPSFSPDMKFISSGDSEGRVWFWDWRTGRVLKKFKAHNSVVIGSEWHPHETSKLATCSWDGSIKYWE